MTKFAKGNFESSAGGYLHYNTGTARKFVARFKHRGPVTKAKFLATLIKHYSVEEYFSKIEILKEAPLRILENDGLLSFHYGENGARNYFVLDGKAL